MLAKFPIVKAIAFPVVIYRYDSWTVKKAEHTGEAVNYSFLKSLAVDLCRSPRIPGAFPVAKESACSAGDSGSISGSGRYSGGGDDNPLQYSYLENPGRGSRGAWWAPVHGVTKSWT